MVRQDKFLILMTSALLGLASITWAQSDTTSTSPNLQPDIRSDQPSDQPSDQQEEELISDLLIVLDSDGRSHTAQHSLSSNGPKITLRLPGSVVPQEVLIFGPAQDAQREAYRTNPRMLSLENGTAFVRYQHQYGNEVEQIQPGHFVLSLSSVPSNIDANRLTQSAITWVFPSEYELVSYTVTDTTTGNWVLINNTLTFYQLSTEPVQLTINYKHRKATQLTSSTVCPEDAPQNQNCTDDLDEDGVPDYRDICISELGVKSNDYGCRENHSMILEAVDFSTGRTYLDVSARAALDRVAKALNRTPETYFEIGSHTDNEGAASSNLALSKKRANAVRHYLILNGVNPNAVRATGYGEQYPIRDNSSADGRRANRRVELVIIN